MTICIGVTCENAKKAIAVSDRMLTSTDLTLAFEYDAPKRDELTSNCIALTAGSALVHIPLFRKVAEQFREAKSPRIEDVVDEVEKEYAGLRLKEIRR